MRVSTSQIYNIADVGMRNAQAAINKTSEQISTGKRVLSPADDPVAAVSILRLNQNLGRLEQYQKNVDEAQSKLDQEEVALDSIVSLLQRMKELAVNAGNTGVMTPTDYQSMAAEVDSRLSELLDLQNTRDSAGQYIFAGYQGDTKPFVSDGGGKFSYHGDEGQQRIQVSESVSVAVSDSGKDLFVDVPSGHNTFNTSASPANKGVPPAEISIGEVVDQEAYDEFYPRDMTVTFNAPEALSPPKPNYTITDDRGRVLMDKAPYSQGEPIEIKGARFYITGQPLGGEPAVPGTLDFGAVAATDFTGSPETVTLTVGGRSETLVLDRPVSNAADLAAALSSSTETTAGSGADRNAERLANLGVTVDATGLSVPTGQNLTVGSGTANTDAVFGFATQNDGSTSNDGALAEPGDTFQVNASNNQGLLTTLSRFSEAMKNVKGNPESKAELSDVVGQTLTNLENSMTHLTAAQGELGARQNTLESTQELLSETKIHNEEFLADIESLDYAEASTRLQMESMVLSAAQQAFVKVSGLSLFNYL
ncbi:flagellar hook-associated protein FlgL [Marinimicrobium locisalis]|uniref:flagellar hook-associated protein FlgL n=1 Tax=Marinimicrobium locisalis TaxID=546022 RepID=UPI0032219724